MDNSIGQSPNVTSHQWDSPIVKYVVPSIGGTMGVIMLLSPIKAVWQIRKTQELGEINPLPYPLTALNCLGWIIYAAVIKDWFIGPPNIVGLVAGVFFTMTAFPFCKPKLQDLILGLLCGGSALFGILSLVDTFALDLGGRKTMWGIVCVIILLVYYVIPLSTILDILKRRDASSIYLPLSCCALLNGSLWGVYGLAIQDIYVWGPNVFGLVIGCVQIGLRLYFGKGKSKPAPFPFERNGDAPMLSHQDSATLSLLSQPPSFNSSAGSERFDRYNAPIQLAGGQQDHTNLRSSHSSRFSPSDSNHLPAVPEGISPKAGSSPLPGADLP